MTSPLFALRGLCKSFPNGTTALQGIDLDIIEGECLLVAGSNGSGKTVLMHILAGLSRPSSGSLHFRGVPLPAALSRPDGGIRGGVGLVFQDADAQLLGETVAEDVAYGPRERGVRGAELEERGKECIKLAGLEGKESWPPASLSGGEKRRLAVAGILAVGAGCIIMDEPFANLDWPGIRQVLAIIRDLKAKGHSLIILTHELEKVLAHADRLAILDRGRIRDIGRPLEVLDRGLEQWGVRDPRHRYDAVEDCTWLD